MSPDLVHWEHLGVALLPTKDYDRSGVFSGSAMEIDGRLHLYYSAVKYDRPKPEDIHLADGDRFETSQAMVISPDGRQFDNWGGKEQIIPVLTDPAVGDKKDTRDPKVWREKDGYRIILGSTRDGSGRVIFFRSEDGEKWTYANQYASPQLGRILECPDLMKTEDGYIFVGSPMGVTADGLSYADQAMFARADFDPDTCALTLREPLAYLDWGLDLYAPQSALDREGRRVLVGWMRMPKPVENWADGRGPWNGMMSLPRLVQVRDGKVCFPVHPDVDACFDKPAHGLAPLAEYKPVRLRAILREGDSLNLGEYRIPRTDGRIEAGRSGVFDGLQGCRLTARTPVLEGDSCRLDIFADQNLVEIFVNQGEYVLSHVVYGLGTELEGPVEEARTI